MHLDLRGEIATAGFKKTNLCPLCNFNLELTAILALHGTIGLPRPRVVLKLSGESLASVLRIERVRPRDD
jgi:hypothetical protein